MRDEAPFPADPRGGGGRLARNELDRRVQRSVAAARLTARRFALRRGWRQGHTDYTRFVILGRSRTGTNMVRSSVDEHRAGVCYGELFRSHGSIGWDRWPLVGSTGQSRRLVSFSERDPIGLLERRVFGVHEPGVGAVGFKMFYYYARSPAWSGVWTWIDKNTDIHILHVRRRNVLRTYLSHLHASRTDEWIAGVGGAAPPPPLVLVYDECREFFEKTRRWEAEYDARFSGHPTLDLYYEDMVRDFDDEIARVQAFLGLPVEPIRPRTRKQSRLPLSKAIVNYEELRRRFGGTEWTSFFEDPSAEPAVDPTPRPESG